MGTSSRRDRGEQAAFIEQHGGKNAGFAGSRPDSHPGSDASCATLSKSINLSGLQFLICKNVWAEAYYIMLPYRLNALVAVRCVARKKEEFTQW